MDAARLFAQLAQHQRTHPDEAVKGPLPVAKILEIIEGSRAD
jgi:hypothetical protein